MATPQGVFVSGDDQRPFKYTPSGADVALGQVVLLTDHIGIAIRPIEDGELGSLATAGKWRMHKVTELAIVQGDTVYWDLDGVPAEDSGSTAGAISTNPEVTITAGGAVAGVAAEAAALDDTHVVVELQIGTLLGDTA